MVEFLIGLSQSPLSLAIATSPWIVPAMQSIHIMSIAILFISVLVVALRVMGVAWGGVSVRGTAERFAPWAWTALAALGATGVILILAEPLREIMAISFWVKMCLLVATIIISVRFLREVRSNDGYAVIDGPVDAATRRKAIFTIAILVAIIFMGRFIAYDPLVWGQLSPVGSV